MTRKQHKALKWWNRAIQEGERLGASLELSRVYLEVGRHLLAEKSRARKLDGKRANEYITKAGVMFEEMALQWDSTELDRVTQFPINGR